MKIYELCRNGKRSKYRTLELAIEAAKEGDAVYEVEFDGSRTVGLCDYLKAGRISEKLVYENKI